MSKSAARLTDTIFPGAGTASAAGTDAVVSSMTPDIPSQDIPTRGDPANDVKKQSEQIATRDQQARVALVASGITSTANERDLLGGALRPKNASRALVGGR